MENSGTLGTILHLQKPVRLDESQRKCDWNPLVYTLQHIAIFIPKRLHISAGFYGGPVEGSI